MQNHDKTPYSTPLRSHCRAFVYAKRKICLNDAYELKIK